MPANRQYKDSVFTLLFRDKKKLIELYNAIEGTNYSLDTKVEINTLEEAMIYERLNDISFVIDGKLVVLIEHQSSINPNMPLRMLLYIGRIYEKILDNQIIYAERQIKIPTPEFYVMYNGTKEYPKEKTIKLSEAYIERKEEIELELSVKVLNINYDANNEVLNKVKILKEYSQFIENVRSHEREGMNLTEAIEKAIKECIRKGILKEFLEKHGSEVENMLFTEWDYEKAREVIFNDGVTIGIEKGEERKALSNARNFLDMGLSIEQVAKGVGLPIEQIRDIAKYQ